MSDPDLANRQQQARIFAGASCVCVALVVFSACAWRWLDRKKQNGAICGFPSKGSIRAKPGRGVTVFHTLHHRTADEMLPFAQLKQTVPLVV